MLHKKLLVILAMIIFMAGCGGGLGSSSNTSATSTATGYFIDSPVQGLSYVSGSQSGTTDANGKFTYEVGKTVKFSIGNIVLGEVSAKGKITPVDLVANADASNIKVLNISRFLMTLDSDGDASNGITISDTTKTAAQSASSIDFSTATDATLTTTLATLTTNTLVSSSTAQSHLTSSVYGLYAGSYSGTYSGTSSGTWAVTIDSNGTITGTGTPSSGSTFSVSGQVTTSGAATFSPSGSTSNGASFSGTIDVSTGAMSGTWSNSSSGGSGTWTGTKQTATNSTGIVQLSNVKAFQSSTGTQAPDLLAIDGSGNIWVGSRAYGTVMRLQPDIATSNCSAGCTLITKPNNYLHDLAVDTLGNIWISDSPGNLGSPTSTNVALAYIDHKSLAVTNVYPNSTELNSNLTLYGQADAGSIAIDSSGNIVVGGNAVFNSNGSLNYSLVLTTISVIGSVLTNYTIPTTVITNVRGFYPIVAFDGSGNTWALFSDLFSPFLLKYSAGSPGTPVSYTLPGGVIPLKITFDSTGTAWIVTSTEIGSGTPTGTGILKISATAQADCTIGCTSYASPAYLAYPKDIAVDGDDTVWVVGSVNLSSLGGYDAIGVTKIVTGAATDCSSGCTAYLNSQFMNTPNASPGGIAIDGNGNVWLENYTDGAVVELPAIAAPTTNPIVTRINSGTNTTSGGGGGTTTSDTTAPSSPSVLINNGSSSTTSSSVTLTLSASDNKGITGYFASETSTKPSASASGWTSITSTTNYSASVSFTLSSGSGTKTVYVWFKDAAGNVSASASDSIILY